MCFLGCLSWSVFSFPPIFFFHFISMLHLLNFDINLCVFCREYISIMIHLVVAVFVSLSCLACVIKGALKLDGSFYFNIHFLL
jgi:hypothetical protein